MSHAGWKLLSSDFQEEIMKRVNESDIEVDWDKVHWRTDPFAADQYIKYHAPNQYVKGNNENATFIVKYIYIWNKKKKPSIVIKGHVNGKPICMTISEDGRNSYSAKKNVIANDPNYKYIELDEKISFDVEKYYDIKKMYRHVWW